MNNAQSAQIIKDFCKSKEISISKMLSDCEIRKSLIYDMEKRDWTPSAKLLEKIADYLDCSVDYLLGSTDNPDSSVPGALSDKEQQLLDAYRNKIDVQSAVDILLGLNK